MGRLCVSSRLQRRLLSGWMQFVGSDFSPVSLVVVCSYGLTRYAHQELRLFPSLSQTLLDAGHSSSLCVCSLCLLFLLLLSDDSGPCLEFYIIPVTSFLDWLLTWNWYDVSWEFSCSYPLGQLLGNVLDIFFPFYLFMLL